MQYFAVIATPRSGSTRLCTILGRHPSIACHLEIFHQDEVQAYFGGNRSLEIMDRDRRDADPARFLDRFLAFGETWFKDRTHLGFKVLLNARQGRAAAELVAPDPRLRKVVLRRDNLFACYTSRCLAVESGMWQRVEGEPGADREHGKKLVFDASQFHAFAGFQLLASAAIVAALRRAGHRYLELEYGECLTPEGLARVYAFLGVSAVADPGSHRKVNTRPLLECYQNPDDARAAMRAIGRPEWLVGDEITARSN